MAIRRVVTASLLAGAGAVAACAGEGDPTWDDPSWTCVASSVDDFGSEETIAHMHAPGLPADLEWRRDGMLNSIWTYSYDLERRLLVQETDFFDADGIPPPDGVPDQRRTLTHTADETRETFGNASDGGDDGVPDVPVDPNQTTVYTIDPNGWVEETRTGQNETRYQVSPDGWLGQLTSSAFDPETGPFTRTERYERTAEDLLSRRITTDTRQGPTEFVIDYIHDFSSGRHVIRTTGAGSSSAVFNYTRDGQGRLVRAAVDDDADGTDDWVVDITRATDGALTATGSRDGASFRTHTFSAGCAMELDEPWAPRAMRRPGPTWRFTQPSMPALY